MQDLGFYYVYHTNTKSQEEAQKMAYEVKLLEDLKKWASMCGDLQTKKFTNPFGCAQKIVFFVLEGTKYKWENFNSAQRVELFFEKLAECRMQGSSRNKYAQGFRKFVAFISTRGKEGPKNLDIQYVNSVVKALIYLDKRQCSLATAEKSQKEQQRAFSTHSFNNEDYRNMKDGVANFMLPILWRLSRNQLLNEDIPNLTAYLCFQVSFMFGHRPGVPENMTIEELMNRQLVEDEGVYVILVEKHKTTSLKSAGVAISLEEEKTFLEYLEFARPALLKSGAAGPKNFLVSQKGRKLQNVSKIMNKFLRKIFPNGMRLGVSVPTQTTVRHLITAINRRATNKTQEQCQMMHEYLCHSEITSKNHCEAYEFKRIAASRNLLQSCSEEVQKCSASEAIEYSDEEEEESMTMKIKFMDVATRKRVVNDALNRVLIISPLDASSLLISKR
ncbi:uncharacterized protein LOC136029580 [Artemia franciscana]|uniref:uncharacterized protein LOC136029580 n=1 Tax=Artemia franciscana TaxID=6661 RepID=UPI0032DB1F58